MKKYEKRVEEYKTFIQTQYIRESAVEDVIRKCEIIMKCDESIFSNEGKISFFEFLYEQSKFIQKRWWILQGGIVLLSWILLEDFESREIALRMLPIIAVMFSILIIPEIWKNKRFSAVEIEKAAFYSLRQICAARLLLFAIIDIAMMTIFFVFAFSTLRSDVYKLIINFLIPFNVSCCISFRLLYSKWLDMEYVAVVLNIVCAIVWSIVVRNDFIYKRMAMSVWIGVLVLSFGYLIYCVKKSQYYCGLTWEERTNGITV